MIDSCLIDSCDFNHHYSIIYVGGPKEFLPVLRSSIGEDCLPTNYGGKRPALGEISALLGEHLQFVATNPMMQMMISCHSTFITVTVVDINVHPYAELMHAYRTDDGDGNDIAVESVVARSQEVGHDGGVVREHNTTSPIDRADIIQPPMRQSSLTINTIDGDHRQPNPLSSPTTSTKSQRNGNGGYTSWLQSIITAATDALVAVYSIPHKQVIYDDDHSTVGKKSYLFIICLFVTHIISLSTYLSSMYIITIYICLFVNHIFPSMKGDVEFSDAFETQSDLESNSHRYSDIFQPNNNTRSTITGYDDHDYDGHNHRDGDHRLHRNVGTMTGSHHHHHHHDNGAAQNRPHNIVDYICLKQVVMGISDQTLHQLMYSSVCVHMLCAFTVGKDHYPS